MKASKVTLFTPEGEAVEYRRLSARLPDFLERYPLEQGGYRLTEEISDMLSLMPEVKDLYKTAIAAGRKPEEVGLPPISQFLGIVVKQNLMFGDEILASAVAHGLVECEKDLEKRETSSLQRLMAKLGMGGEVFDEDEGKDFDRQGLRPATSMSVVKSQPVAAVMTSVTAPTAPAEAADTAVAAEPARASDPEVPEPIMTSPASDGVEAPVGTDTPRGRTRSTLASVMLQIRNTARQRGVKTIPDFHGEREAREFLRKLHKNEIPAG